MRTTAINTNISIGLPFKFTQTCFDKYALTVYYGLSSLKRYPKIFSNDNPSPLAAVITRVEFESAWRLLDGVRLTADVSVCSRCDLCGPRIGRRLVESSGHHFLQGEQRGGDPIRRLRRLRPSEDRHATADQVITRSPRGVLQLPECQAALY